MLGLEWLDTRAKYLSRTKLKRLQCCARVVTRFLVGRGVEANLIRGCESNKK